MVLPTVHESSVKGSVRGSVLNVSSDEEALRIAGKEEVLKVSPILPNSMSACVLIRL